MGNQWGQEINGVSVVDLTVRLLFLVSGELALVGITLTRVGVCNPDPMFKTMKHI